MHRPMKKERITHGRVLVIGGSEEYVGAPYLAGICALRSGAESVIVMTPEKVAWAINALTPDLVTRKLKGKYLSLTHLPQIRRQLRTADILIIGNGTGTKPGTTRLLRALMEWEGKKVIDADALKVLSFPVENAILTPNEREWKLLERNVGIPALRARNVLVKKGFPTKILSARKTFAIRPDRGLQKAGTGDVLAGLCAGFLAEGCALFEAARIACLTGNRAAKVLAKRKSGYYLAGDIAKELQFARMKTLM